MRHYHSKVLSRALASVPVLAALLPMTLPSAAEGASASQWTRSVGGAVVDLFDLTPKGEGWAIALREGFGKPVYSSGFCTPAGGKVVCSNRSTSGGRTIHIVLTPRGNTTHYRSSTRDDGSDAWDGDFVRAQGSTPPPTPQTSGVRYRVENFVYGAPDLYRNPRNYHDFVVDFAKCSLREMNQPSAQGLEQIRVSVCRNNSRLQFTTTGPNSTLVEYDWVFLDGGKTISGAYRQGGTFGPSVGGVYNP